MAKKILIYAATAVLSLLITASVYLFFTYYHADDVALAALEGSDKVKVTVEADVCWFDGPGSDSMLVFYPGARVEARSYAPLMKSIAEKGVDCCICSMPFRLAYFDKGSAEAVRSSCYDGTSPVSAGGNSYSHWYIGGHSLGGVEAVSQVYDEMRNKDPDAVSRKGWDGVILCGSYPNNSLGIPVLSVYGSEDKIVDPGKEKLEKIHAFCTAGFDDEMIEGANHAGFGNYGTQFRDGTAKISSDEQQKQTAKIVVSWIRRNNRR